ncbi:MAG: Mur ligase family protein [Patescibacteria group bacterium]
MVGVKGAGMAALAEVLAANGFLVSGSDVAEDFFTAPVLARLGIVPCPFDEKNIAGVEAVIHSNAYNNTNPELHAARERGMPVFSYPEVVAELFNACRGIAVAGSHGKTTTTAMLAHILKTAGSNTTAIVGSLVANWSAGALAGDLHANDASFVLEADEYKDAFLNYKPYAACITNIDYDHPDYFRDPRQYIAAFERFVAGISNDGFVVVDASDESAYAVARSSGKRMVVSAAHSLHIPLAVPGAHNAHNAALAYTAARELGVSNETARVALADFHGTERRMEYIGERNGVSVFDDYAHHPSEIRASLAAFCAQYPEKNILVVFQPHTYSRTAVLFDDFSAAFAGAHEVVLADVYASRRERKEDHPGVDMERMAECIMDRGIPAVFIKEHDRIVPYLKERLVPGAIVVTMGAGDIWRIGRILIQ